MTASKKHRIPMSRKFFWILMITLAVTIGVGSNPETAGSVETTSTDQTSLGYDARDLSRTAVHGSICDGKSHQLKSYFPTIDAAKSVYSQAVSLNDEVDTVVINNALKMHSTVYLPAGICMDSGIALNGGNSLIGEAGGLGYAGDRVGSSAIRPTLLRSGNPTSMVNVTGVKSFSVKGLMIDCNDGPTDGISGGGIQGYVDQITVLNCRWGLGSDPSVKTDRYTHNSNIINSVFAYNYKSGISDIIDSSVTGGSVTSNRENGIFLGPGSFANNFLGVRIEWNSACGMATFGAANIQIVGGMFDRNGSSGACFNSSHEIVVSAVIFNRNGSQTLDLSKESAHWSLNQSYSILFSSVLTEAGVNDDGSGAKSPKFVITNQTDDALHQNIIISNSNLMGFTDSMFQGNSSSFHMSNNIER